jgi:FKBP-type peptidyl-prolyl cis-trans isomerase FklB
MRRWRRWGATATPVAAFSVALALAGCDSPERSEGAADGPAETAPTDAQELAYGVGYYLGLEVREGLAADGVDADPGLIHAGFQDGLLDRPSRWSEEELEAVLQAVHEEMQRRTVQRLLLEDPDFRLLHDENLARSNAYLAENRERPGVRELDSGIQYEVLATGAGDSPKSDDVAIVNFTAAHINGLEFESSDGHLVEMNDTLPGARILLAAMSVGDTWRVVVPPDLAYGPAGDPPLVGPNEALVLEVELLEVR